MARVILHIDMDAFFPAVEERENPQFRGKPIVVGADPKGGKGRGVVSSASYSARKYGIHSAMPISKAFKLCPKAIFLPVNMELYQKVSENIMKVLQSFLHFHTSKYRSKGEMEIVSLDEAYLDLSFLFSRRCSQFKRSLKLVTKKRKAPIKRIYKRAENLAKKLKKEIFEKEKLTCTIGIGPNKLIAKIASKRAKPNGLLVIKPFQVKEFLSPLDIEDLPGIGPKTGEKLRKLGINKIRDLRKLSKTKLKEMFGKVGESIYEKARGIDKEPVTSEKIIKSVGKQYTFEKDTRNPKIIFSAFEKIINDLWQELLENNFSFKTITVLCRFSGFETHTKSKTLKKSTQDLEILESQAKKLLLKFIIENPKSIRLVGLRIKIC